MIAIRAEKLFQIIIGPGQIRHRIAGEESWPVTPGDLPEVPQRRCKRAGRSLMSRHRAQESPEATLHGQCCVLVLVAEDVGRLMDPAKPHTDVGPYISRVSQAACKQDLEPTSLPGQGPLVSTRAR